MVGFTASPPEIHFQPPLTLLGLPGPFQTCFFRAFSGCLRPPTPRTFLGTARLQNLFRDAPALSDLAKVPFGRPMTI